MTPPRYPFEDLERFVAARVTPANGGHGELGGIVSFFGRNNQNLYYRARRAGSLSTLQADRLAVSLGALPWEIWPTFLEDALDEPRCFYCREAASWGRVDVQTCSRACQDLLRLERELDSRRASTRSLANSSPGGVLPNALQTEVLGSIA